MSWLAQNLAEVDARIAARLLKSGRAPGSVTRIVVSKFHPASLVRELNELGVSDFGENRDQEASAKAEELDDLKLTWHFIGQLQSNKVKSVLGYASAIHSLDRQSLLDALVKQTSAIVKSVDVFVQVWRGPEVDELDVGVLRADAVDAADLLPVDGAGGRGRAHPQAAGVGPGPDVRAAGLVRHGARRRRPATGHAAAAIRFSYVS